MASAVGTQTSDTGASAAASSMQMAQKDAVSLTDLYSQVMNDVKQLQSAGQSGSAPNTAIAHDVNNAVRAGQQMQYDYFTSLNQMNAPAHEFVNAATDQLQMMQLGAESGRIDLSGMQKLAQNVTEALSPLVPQAAPAAPAASTAASSDATTVAAGTASLDAASPAMAKVTSDLASEASATTTADKAGFNAAAIKDLLTAVGSPAPSAAPAPMAATPAVATPAVATPPPAAAPAPSPAMSQQLGTDVLQALGQLSDVANQSGAPASTQDAIARLIGLIQTMFRSAAAPGTSTPTASAPVATAAKPATAQAAAPAPMQAMSCQPAVQPAAAATTQPAADTSGLVAVLQQLQGILDQLKPYLANSPKGNAAMDSVAKVVGEIAKALQGGVKTAVA